MEKNISKASLLFSKRKSLVSECILTFLNEKEQLISAKICKSLLKATKMLIDSWPRNMLKISEKFNIDLTTDSNKENIDTNIFKHIINKRAFHLSNKKSNFIQFLLCGKFRYFALAIGEQWAWYNDERYWKKIKLSNSTLGMDSYELKSVCWVDLKLNFLNVKPGKYKVFLRQGLRDYDNVKNQMKLEIVIKANDNNNMEHCLFKTDFMNEEMHKEIRSKINNDEHLFSDWEDKYLIETKSKRNILMDCYVTTIDIPELTFDENLDFQVILKFNHSSGSWKSGWIIDGAILQKI